MKIKRILKVFIVTLSVELEKIPESERHKFKQFKCFIGADNATQAYEAGMLIAKDWLNKYEWDSFDVIEVTRSYTDWRIAELEEQK